MSYRLPHSFEATFTLLDMFESALRPFTDLLDLAFSVVLPTSAAITLYPLVSQERCCPYEGPVVYRFRIPYHPNEATTTSQST